MTSAKKSLTAAAPAWFITLVAMALAVSGCGLLPGPKETQSTPTVPTVQPLGACPATRIGTPCPASPDSNWSGAGLMVLAADEVTVRDRGGYVGLEIEPPASPEFRILTGGPASSIAWGPNGCIAYVAERDEKHSPETIYLRYFGIIGNPVRTVDLLPGDLARQSVSTHKVVHGWLDGGTLAYEEHVGTGVQRLGLINTLSCELIKCPELLAFSFSWEPGGPLLAGQMDGPAGFWIWERVLDKLLLESSQSLSAGIQRFEAWGPSGPHIAASVFFTAWPGPERPYAGATLRCDLHQYDLRTRACTKVASGAGLAAQAGGKLAYVKSGRRLTLVVRDIATGKVLWEQDLGVPPRHERIESSRPVMCDDYVLYRTSRGEWWLSPAQSRQPVLLMTGPTGSASLSPDAAFAAIFAEGMATIFRNPFK